MRGIKAIALLLCFLLLLGLAPAAPAFADEPFLRVEDGMMQPVLTYSDPRAADYSNAESEILRYCVYVETDHDTDGDGLADLVKVFVQLVCGHGL